MKEVERLTGVVKWVQSLNHFGSLETDSGEVG